jgi:hypothetical protein
VNEAVKAVVVDRLRRGPGPAARHALAAPPAGPPPSRWSLRALRATFPWWEGLTLSGVWRALRRLGLGLRAAAVQRYSPDPDYLAKEARLRACLRAAAATPDAVAALFLDETGYARWPDPGADWGLVAPAPRPVAGRAGSKQRLWRVLGALNALTGQVDYLDAYVVGREKVSAFYRQLDRRYAALRRLYVIQDNRSIHRHPDVRPSGVPPAAGARSPHALPDLWPQPAPYVVRVGRVPRVPRQGPLRHLLSDRRPRLERAQPPRTPAITAIMEAAVRRAQGPPPRHTRS